ncbi:MAG: family N-acetyltransferase [Clostridiaceae bacterium]|nr:family N-acetyltransferase [Clostridiaceae bacterium]
MGEFNWGMKLKKFIQQLSKSNLEDFFTLFSNDKCENCQCTFYFSADNIDNWAKMSIEEAKKLRESVTSKCNDGYIYYIDNEPAAWCQCVSPKDALYLKRLLSISNEENTKQRLFENCMQRRNLLWNL